MSPNRWPPRAANLLLCEYATVSSGEVFISRGGHYIAPPPGRPWYLAGTVSMSKADAAHPWLLRVCEEGTDTEVLDATGQPIMATLEFHVTFGEGEVPDDAMGLLGLAIPLPDTKALPPGDYDWVFSTEQGDFQHRTNFTIRPA